MHASRSSRSARSVNFPTFERPPVTEVVVGLSFRTLDKLTVPLIGELWNKSLKEHFPNVEEHPTYEPPAEQFDTSIPGPGLAWQFGILPSLPRLWFLNEVGDELLQVQRNWFSCNWRRVSPKAEYGRWQPRRDAFQRWLDVFIGFVEDNKIGPLTPIQAEVTYVNHVRPSDLWTQHGQLPRFLRLAGSGAGDFLPEPEQMQVAAQYVIRDQEQPIGRLHVTAQPGIEAGTNDRIFVLTLTARGRPEDDGIAGVYKFLDRGREWIVKGFVDVTTDAAHRVWGLHG